MKSFSRLLFFLSILNLLFSHLKCSLKMKTTNIDKCKNFNLSFGDFRIDSFTGLWYPISKSSNLPIFTNCDQITFAKSNGQLSGEIANRKKTTRNATKTKYALRWSTSLRCLSMTMIFEEVEIGQQFVIIPK